MTGPQASTRVERPLSLLQFLFGGAIRISLLRRHFRHGGGVPAPPQRVSGRPRWRRPLLPRRAHRRSLGSLFQRRAGLRCDA